MKLPNLLAAAAALLLCAASARAEDNFARITCIPESRYLVIDYEEVDYQSTFDGVDNRKQELRILQGWKRQGYYVPEKVRYACVFPQARFSVLIDRDPYKERGQCAAAPRITFSLLRNGTPVLSKVVFGDDCFGTPSVTRVKVHEDIQGNLRVALCVMSGVGGDANCEDIESRYPRDGRFQGGVIHQGDIAALADKFDKRTARHSAATCQVSPLITGPFPCK